MKRKRWNDCAAPWPLRVTGVLALVAAIGVGCADLGTNNLDDGYGAVQLHANLAGTPATLLEIEVTGPDIPDGQVFTIEGENGIAAAPLELPYGLDRTLSIRAVDANGVTTHTGATTIDVQAHEMPTVTFDLKSSFHFKPVRIRLGVYVVTVTPQVSEIKVGEEIQFEVAVENADGETMHGLVLWSTTNRAVAYVDFKGVVTGEETGVATIAANYRGTIGLARVFVAGDRAQFFVDGKTGADDAVGNRAAPFATVQKAIAAAAATGSGGDVYLAGGSYPVSITLRSNVNIYGGFDSETWRPLIRWTEQDVIDIHTRHGVLPCPLYLEGSRRVGCWPCIHANKAALQHLSADPGRVQAIRLLEALVQDMAATRAEAKGVEPGPPPTLFQQTMREPDGTRPSRPIDEILTWANTRHGGRQMLIGSDWGSEPGCARWGVCSGS